MAVRHFNLTLYVSIEFRLSLHISVSLHSVVQAAITLAPCRPRLNVRISKSIRRDLMSAIILPTMLPDSRVVLPMAVVYPIKSFNSTPKVAAVEPAFLIEFARSCVVRIYPRFPDT